MKSFIDPPDNLLFLFFQSKLRDRFATAVKLAVIVMGMGMFFKKKYVVQSERMEEINGQES